MKKVVLTLLGVMFISFGLAAFIFSLDGNQPKPVTGEVNVRKSFPAAGLQEIQVEAQWQDVRVIPVEGEEVRIHLHGPLHKGSRPDVLSAIVSGGTLEVSTKSSHRLHYELSFFGKEKSGKTVMVDVYLPKSYRQDLRLETTSGSLTVTDLHLKNWECRTTSGDVDIQRMVAQQVALKTSSGEIRINELKAEELSLETHSGEVEAQKMIEGETTVRTTSGDVDFAALRGDLQLATTAGSFECDDLEGNLKAKTTSGDINVHYTRFRHQVDIETTAGNVKLGLPQNAEFGLEFSSNAGEYDSNFPLTLTGASRKSKISGSVGKGQNRIWVRTTSGDFILNRE